MCSVNCTVPPQMKYGLYSEKNLWRLRAQVNRRCVLPFQCLLSIGWGSNGASWQNGTQTSWREMFNKSNCGRKNARTPTVVEHCRKDAADMLPWHMPLVSCHGVWAWVTVRPVHDGTVCLLIWWKLTFLGYLVPSILRVSVWQPITGYACLKQDVLYLLA